MICGTVPPVFAVAVKCITETKCELQVPIYEQTVQVGFSTKHVQKGEVFGESLSFPDRRNLR